MTDETQGPSEQRPSDPGSQNRPPASASSGSWFDDVFGARDRTEPEAPSQAGSRAESPAGSQDRSQADGWDRSQSRGQDWSQLSSGQGSSPQNPYGPPQSSAPEPTMPIDPRAGTTGQGNWDEGGWGWPPRSDEPEPTAPLWTGWSQPDSSADDPNRPGFVAGSSYGASGSGAPTYGPAGSSYSASAQANQTQANPTQANPTQANPTQANPTQASSGTSWGAPYPAPNATPLPPNRPPRKRRSRTGAVILASALVALLVGGAAGYGGSRLAERPSADATTSPGTSAPTRGSSSPAPTRSAPGQADVVAVAKKMLPSTVTIRVSAGQQGGTGSGFVLDRSGRILTNNHVVSAAGDSGRLQVVFSDGSTEVAQLVGRSPSYDLAVIQVDETSKLVPVTIGNSDQTLVGEPAIAIGSPLGLGGTVTEGIISAKNRPVAVNESSNTDTPSAYIDALQTDAPINPGNSGGPLVDADGAVIGVNSAILTLGGASQSGQSGNIGLGFAIPINQAMEIGKLLIRDGVATYPVIGASTASSTTDTGVLLQSVDPGQPAEQAGLQAGDLVTAIDDRQVSRPEELIVAIRTHRPGDTVRLTYFRNGSTSEATVRLGSKEG